MRYWIGLGANLGARSTTLRGAADALEQLGIARGRSSLYASAAVGGPEQPSYLNAALVIDSDLAPLQLLGRSLELEAAFGRDRAKETRWGPRILDIDVLMIGERGDHVLALPGLDVPHPRLHERAFALAGLVELDETLFHPLQARTVGALLRDLSPALSAVHATGERL